MSGDHISLVVDQTFGERARAQSDLGPLWLIKSPANTTAIEQLWASKKFGADHLTLFDDKGYDAVTAALNMLDTIDMHHAGWRSLEIIGVQTQESLSRALQDYGAHSAGKGAAGFVYHRDNSAP